jgi:selenocysteine lyase/cysteine desulfurase
MPVALRELFPITRRFAYLDHAAIAPLALPVIDAMQELVSHRRDEPFDVDRWHTRRTAVRAAAAALLGTTPARVAFVRNTTAGLALVARGLAWKPGDNVVGVQGEYPANIYPWMALEADGVQFRLYRPVNGRIELSGLLQCCNARTRVVAISWVQFWSGFRTNVADLGDALHARGIFLVVDGIQGLGALRCDFDGWPIDFICAGAPKWLLGPLGIGIAAIGPRMLEHLRPITVGMESIVRDREWFEYDPTLKPDAGRFEESTASFAGILGVGAAIGLLLEHGTRAVEERVLMLTDRIREGVCDLGYELIVPPRCGAEASGIVVFKHPAHDSAALYQRLRDAGVILSLRGGNLRASPHFYNDHSDIDRLLEALPR